MLLNLVYLNLKSVAISQKAPLLEKRLNFSFQKSHRSFFSILDFVKAFSANKIGNLVSYENRNHQSLLNKFYSFPKPILSPFTLQIPSLIILFQLDICFQRKFYINSKQNIILSPLYLTQ